MPLFEDKSHQFIPDFFRGKSILITGGTGFLGRVLIEKLLRSCPDIKNLYVLIRPKRNKSIQERVEWLLDAALFDKLKNENEQVLKKIVPVIGDTQKIGLGLSEEDRKHLIENVTIIFHSAASVRFDDHLKYAIFTNIRSIREVIYLAKELKKIEVLVHVSTAYCNADYDTIEEKLYPRHNWKDVIEIAETCEESVLEVMTQKYIHPLPNTYTFTKAVAEHVVNDLCRNSIPAVIIRPSIVLASIQEPIFGWIDNFNGPMALTVAGAKGILRTAYGDFSVHPDYVFVDNVVKAIIIASWKKSLENNTQDILICNATSDLICSLQAIKNNEIAAQHNPPKTYLGPVNVHYTKCWYKFMFYFVTLQILPALLIDEILAILGQKRRLLAIQRRVFLANTALSKFLLNDWDIRHDNYIALEKLLAGNDARDFSFLHTRLSGEDSPEIQIIFTRMWAATKLYLLKEEPIATKQEVQKFARMVLIINILKYIFIGMLYYFVVWKQGLVSKTCQMIYNYFENLDKTN